MRHRAETRRAFCTSLMTFALDAKATTEKWSSLLSGVIKAAFLHTLTELHYSNPVESYSRKCIQVLSAHVFGMNDTSRFPKKSQMNLVLRVATPCCLCILKDLISFHVSVFIPENATFIHFTLWLYNQPCWQFYLYCHSCFRPFPCTHTSLAGTR